MPVESHPSHPGEPRTIANGRYELVGVLGEGGMATVWRCKDTLLGVERAIKILHPEVAERRSYRSRFLAEARTMARLPHPNILQVFDVGEEDGRYWFTMEVVDGGALIDILEQQGRIDPLRALDITFQMLQALAAAHLEGVVHRDIKPDNILLSRDGGVRLSDFGIARIRNERVDHRTRTGVAMGTVGYMSPEQRENARGVGPPADIYATGATLYALVTGCEPPDLFASHLDPKLLEGVPPAIRDVVRNATSYRPEKRYPHARAMAADVSKAYDAVARGKGMPELGKEWLARFDQLVIARARQQAGLDTDEQPLPPTNPVETIAAPPGEAPPWTSLESLERQAVLEHLARTTPRPAPAATSAAQPASGGSRNRLVAVAVVVAVLGALAVAMAWWFVADGFAAAGQSACAGTWAGSVEGPVGDGQPLRLELTAARSGVEGTAVTVFMGQEHAVRVRGRCVDGGEFALDEVDDRADRGSYSGTQQGDRVTGSWTSGDGASSFTVARQSAAGP